MKNKPLERVWCLCALIFSLNALAGIQTFSSSLTGTEPTTLSGATESCLTNNVAYDLVGPFQVSVTGNYEYGDISIDLTGDYLDMAIGLYNGSFNPTSTATNQIGVSDDSDTFALTSGQDYYIVVQDLTCNSPIGRWMFALIGPGNISGTITNDIPNVFVTGEFDGTEQEIDAIACGSDDYHLAFGPLSIPIAGTYGIDDLGYNELSDNSLDTEIALYKGSFDPNNVSTNFLDSFDDSGEIFLESANDYYMVIQPQGCGDNPTNEPFATGLALLVASPVAVPLLSNWLIVLLSILFIGFGFHQQRKTSK